MLNEFYRHAAIRRRIREFIGVTGDGEDGAAYLALGDASRAHWQEARPVGDLELAFAEGNEISRSLWDRHSLLAHIDLEWVNFDDPAAAYEDPGHCFQTQEAVAGAIGRMLESCGIRPLHLLTGRGHHFVWRIPSDSDAFAELQLLGSGWLAPSLETLYATPRPPDGQTVSPAVGTAYAGLGLVLEHLAFEVKRTAAPRTPVPVEITAVEVGPGPRGREMVSIDISQFGDPLSARVVRVPFSLYLKPWQIGSRSESDSPFTLVPLDGMDWREALDIRSDANRAAALAERVSSWIPAAPQGTSRMIARYRKSPLAGYHAWHRAEPWATSNPDSIQAPPALPACGHHLLEYPNDELLKPAGAARVTRLLLSLGWHPRRIVEIIRSRYEEDHGWGDAWTGYDPGTRAEFFVRIFAGQFWTGIDDLVDFNCKSAQEERVCCIPGCRNNLARYQESLLNRRRYERLARRPFHRLLLSEEHL